MIKWDNEYIKFKKSKEWKLFCAFNKNIDIKSIKNLEFRHKAMRLQKMVDHIIGLVDSIDPDIVALDFWKDLKKQLKVFPVLILNKSQQYTTMIKSRLLFANNCADKVFILLRPYVTSDDASAQLAGVAFHLQEKNIIDSLENFNKKSTDAFNKIAELKTNADVMHTEIQNYSITLFGNDTGHKNENKQKSIKNAIEDLFTEFKNNTKKTKDFYTQLFDDSKNYGIKAKITQAQLVFEQNKEIIEKNLLVVESKIKDLVTFYDSIYGTQKEASNSEKQNVDDETKDTRQGGSKKEFEELIIKFNDLFQQQTQTYEALKIQIESLLPGATSAGLASAYGDRKKMATIEAKKYARNFTYSIWALIVIALASAVFTPLIEYWLAEESLATIIFDVERLALRFLWIAPISGPVFWLAFVYSKRRSENSRLTEEYAHKEALAKSYDSYKKQIDALNENNEALLGKLLSAAIDAVAYNPSVTLDKKHGDKFTIDNINNKIGKNDK